MKIAVRAGHMKTIDQGANGLVNEYEVTRAYTPYIISALQRSGIEVIDVTPIEGNADSSWASVHQGIDKANDEGVNLFISCHVNSLNRNDVSGATGYCYKNNTVGAKLIDSIIDSISELGFHMRERMESTEHWELKDTNMTAVIVEPFFCVNKEDVTIYNKVGPKALGEAIAKGILSYLGLPFTSEEINYQQKYNDLLNQYYSFRQSVIDITNKYI